MGAEAASIRDLLEQAADPDRTPFDYVIVGCGAGGGPLAARLARAGKRVLVLDAGADVAAVDSECGTVVPATALQAKLREAYEVPVYYAAASETKPMAWEFSVRHFADTDEQKQDPKYNVDMDPSVTPPPSWPKTGGKGGIFYPRASGVGGCTTHHAMIIVKPNDLDWQRVAELTGDDGWQPDQMQGYFARLEKILYYKAYQSAFRKTLGQIAAWWRRVVAYLNPSDVLDNGGHGMDGWQKTSFISPLLIATIVKTDWTFLRVLLGAILWILKKDGNWLRFLKAIVTLTFVRFLDPNFRRDWPAAANVNLKFIPLGTDGSRRTGVREWVLDTAREHPGNLVVVTCALATRVLFAAGRRGAGEDVDRRPPVPRAIGVEVAIGENLYQASPLSSASASAGAPRRKFFTRGEVILSGGTYNTPQLLMLSGIGDPAELSKHGIEGLRDPDGKRIDAETVALPGVGKNLQDRYEIPVISEVKKDFKVLIGTSLQPNDPTDPQRKEWLETGGGLYSTNGGAIAFLARSGHNSEGPHQPQRPEADLFVFGVPAAFRGYYWGWSSQVYSPVQLPPDAPVDPKHWNLWSWVILKAYTHNAGTVRLRSASPFEQLEIDTHYFARDPKTGERTWGAQQDIEALRAAVEMVREVNDNIGVLSREIDPGREVSDDQLEEWAHRRAWGHHANGTARMGSDPWRRYTSELRDTDAVLDSRFRVHGVERLRVVDASIFPEIPGYFIVTPIFMAAEKAADVLLVDAATYPEQLEAAEAKAVRERREAAFVHPHAEVPGVEGGPLPAARLYGAEEATARATAAAGAAAVVTSSGDVAPPPIDRAELPPDTVGLALSGGGIRSATYGLGVLQALARRGRLRSVDFLSSVSGGGYIGSFLGRLYTRVAPDVADKPAYVERVLKDDRSAQNDWLRTHSNYIAGGGESDVQTNLATIWRNLLAVQLVAGTLVLALFSLLRWISGPKPAPLTFLGLPLSPWWWLPAVLVVVFALPFAYGYWLAPRKLSLPYAAFGVLLWVVLLAGAVAALGITPIVAVGIGGLVILLLSWLWTEVARLDMPPGTGPLEQGVILRNRLTRALGVTVFLFVAALGWVVLDSLARATAGAQSASRPWIVLLAALVLVILPLFRDRVTAMTRNDAPAGGSGVALIAFGILGFLLFALDVIVHWVFDFDTTVGLWLALVAFAVSIVLGRDVGFLNLSSLQTIYAARIARTFLGASNPQRIYPSGAGTPTEVQVPHADDDLPFGAYHPEHNGGPLHLIGVCVNETTDVVSGRHLRQDKGLAMCVGPEGVSVGRRFHSLWGADPLNEQNRITALVRALVARNDPNAFHVLKKRGVPETEVEPLRLSQWIATSGAAFTTGQGRNTKLSLSLLLGLLNVRLGYWWDSRIRAGQRPGAFPPDFWRRLLALPSRIFRTQWMLLDEWRGHFEGPSVRYWYLSDGGHFEATGIYELVRRRLPFIVASDALFDPCYRYADVAQVMRLCQIDFGATFTWLDPVPLRAEGAVGWEAFEGGGGRVPGWIRGWLDPAAIGSWEEIKRNGPYAAALARITYADPWPRQLAWPREESWLLLLKTAVPPGMPLDVRCYAESNPAFPNDSTANQFLTDDQWDAYRELGERTAEMVLTEAPGGVSGTSSAGKPPHAGVGLS